MSCPQQPLYFLTDVTSVVGISEGSGNTSVFNFAPTLPLVTRQQPKHLLSAVYRQGMTLPEAEESYDTP